MRAVAVAASLLVGALGACTGDDADDASSPSTNAATTLPAPRSTTTPVSVPTFTGDTDSEYCVLVREAPERPLLSPFELGIDAFEVELRVRNLRNRFDELVAVAPEELSEDLARLTVALQTVDETLDGVDYEIDRLADAAQSIPGLDDPAFDQVNVNLAAYNDQVCDVATGS